MEYNETEYNYIYLKYINQLKLNKYYSDRILYAIEQNTKNHNEIIELEDKISEYLDEILKQKETIIFLKNREEGWQKNTRELLDNEIKLENKLKKLKRKIKKIKKNSISCYVTDENTTEEELREIFYPEEKK